MEKSDLSVSIEKEHMYDSNDYKELIYGFVDLIEDENELKWLLKLLIDRKKGL